MVNYVLFTWGKKRQGFINENKLLETQSCLKALKWKFGTAIESFPLPILATSSHLFIKTLTQWEKYIDRIKKRAWAEKVWVRKKRKDRRKRKSATCLFCSYCYFSFEVQFVVQILDTQLCSSSGWTRGDMTSSNREEEKWFLFWLFKRVSSKTWHHVDGPGVELDGSDGVMRSLWANKQHCPHCPVKGDQADRVHERADCIAFPINWFTKGRRGQSLQHQEAVHQSSSKANSQCGLGARVYWPTLVSFGRGWASPHPTEVCSQSQREGDVLSIYLCMCVCPCMCVFVCTNMTSLLTGWRLLLSIVVTRGGEENRRWHHKAQFWAEKKFRSCSPRWCSLAFTHVVIGTIQTDVAHPGVASHCRLH